MVKRIAPVGIGSLVLLCACGALCQNVRKSLPDAPSPHVATLTLRFNGFLDEAGSPSKFGGTGAYAGLMRPGGFAVSDKAVFRQKDPDAIFRKYLYPSPLTQPRGYGFAADGSLLGRATYAASRTVITRNDSGKGRLNMSYLLRTLTSVAEDTASRPYWRRSVGEPFSDFGSTVGNDTGVNLWHEFGPGIEHLVKSHTPAFVSRIEERISH